MNARNFDTNFQANSWPTEISNTLTPEQIQSALRTHDLPLISEVAALRQGLSREKFKITFFDNTYAILRLADIGRLPRELLERECAAHEVLSEILPYDVPKVLARGELVIPSAVADKQFVLLTHISGKNVGDLFIPGSALSESLVYEQLGRVLQKFHSIDYSSLPASLRSNESVEQWLQVRISRLPTSLKDAGVNPTLIEQTIEALSERTDLILSFCNRLALLHRDLKPHNVMGFDSPAITVTGVLDFETIDFGDPLLDIASTGIYSSEWEYYLEAPLTQADIKHIPSSLWDESKAQALLAGYTLGAEDKDLWDALIYHSILDQAEIIGRLYLFEKNSAQLIERREKLLHNMLLTFRD